MNTDITLETVGELLRSQRLAVLATAEGDDPYTNIVAFAESADFRRIVFVTMRSTRKYKNLSGNPKASLLMDNRSNQEADFHRATAVTACGPVIDTETGAAADEARELFVAKHPYLSEFGSSPSAALVVMLVDRYVWVDHFQHVVEIRMGGEEEGVRR